MRLRKLTMIALSAILTCLSSCTENDTLNDQDNTNIQQQDKSTSNKASAYPPEVITEFEKEGIDVNKITIEYFADNQPVDHIDNIEGAYPVLSLVKDVNAHSAHITVRTFSTEERYLQYGDQNNLKFRETKKFNEAINQYAQANGLIQMEEAGMDLPDSYYAFEKQQYETYFGAFSPGWLQVFDDIVPYGTNKYIMSPFMPSLNPWPFSGWNNKIGCYKRQHIYMVEHLYDKTFFRKHLVTLSGWGTSTVIFWGILGFVNNKVESMKLY